MTNWIKDPNSKMTEAEKALKKVHENRKGKKFKLVQVGPKSWKEVEIK